MDNEILVKTVSKLNLTGTDTLVVTVPVDSDPSHLKQLRHTLASLLKHDRICVITENVRFKVISQNEVKDEWGRSSQPL